MLLRRRRHRMRSLSAALVLWLCISLAVSAQQAGKMPLVGVLLINTAADPEPARSLLHESLGALGYVEGRDLSLQFRFAEGRAEDFPGLAEALVGDRPDVIVALGDAAARAAQQVTRTIPIVAVADDLVAAGLIQSMAKPGGNTTGVSILATELDAKKVEILKEIVPTARHFALLRDPASSTEARLRAIAEMARALGLNCRRSTSPPPPILPRPSLRCGPAAQRLSTSLPRRCWRISSATSPGSASTTNCRRSASSVRWSRAAASSAMASSARKSMRCSPDTWTRC